jgi:surface protein
MDQLFINATSFNQPLADWDVSSVIIMSDVFQNAESFNQPLSTWNVSNVTDMSYMFAQTDNFNQPLADWDVSNVTNISGIFWEGVKFNQDISIWDVGKVTDMTSMFRGASGFSNHDLSSWDVRSVRVSKRDNFMENAGSGNTPPVWSPFHIISTAEVSFPNITWYSGAKNATNCIKYGKSCRSGNDFKLNTGGGTSQSLIFKFDRVYNGGSFKYYNRISNNHILTDRIIGSNVQFVLKNKVEYQARFDNGYPEPAYGTTKKFDEIRLNFTDTEQNFRKIEITAYPNP